MMILQEINGIQLDPTPYFKIFNNSDNSRYSSIQYSDNALIKDVIPFNDDLNASCVAGGIYYSDVNNIHNFSGYGYYIRLVQRVADDPQIKDKDTSSVKWRSPRLYLHERKSLHYVETWKWLISFGLDKTNIIYTPPFNCCMDDKVLEFLLQDFEIITKFNVKESGKNSILDLGCVKNISLPKLKRVQCSINLYDTYNINLPNLEFIDGALIAPYCEKINLPKLKEVTGYLDVKQSKKVIINEDVKIHGAKYGTKQ